MTGAPLAWVPLGCLLIGALIQVAEARTASSEVRAGQSGLSRNRPPGAEAQIRQSELDRLKEMVRSLGGKPEHASILLNAGRQFEIDPLLLAAVTFVESSFNPTAKSKCGARGLMQLRSVVLNVLGVTNPWDPHENIMAGAAYLRNCFERYDRYENATYLALAAYNIGPGPVSKLTGSDPAERFVRKVLSVYNRLTDEPIPVTRQPLRETNGKRRSAWAEVLELH